MGSFLAAIAGEVKRVRGKDVFENELWTRAALLLIATSRRQIITTLDRKMIMLNYSVESSRARFCEISANGVRHFRRQDAAGVETQEGERRGRERLRCW